MKIDGKVKFFDKTKGYGFIVVQGREKDVFFHAKHWHQAGYQTPPLDGETLQFSVIDGPKGAYAIDIARPGMTKGA